ncbi:hypothetical protein T484DRAFT_1757060 [Baffinella frigidus]|nr:hypothetical protein T484DRAFT_1757060 [Cryptophyta sp. CCMP2293]
MHSPLLLEKVGPLTRKWLQIVCWLDPEQYGDYHAPTPEDVFEEVFEEVFEVLVTLVVPESNTTIFVLTAILVVCTLWCVYTTFTPPPLATIPWDHSVMYDMAHSKAQMKTQMKIRRTRRTLRTPTLLCPLLEQHEMYLFRFQATITNQPPAQQMITYRPSDWTVTYIHVTGYTEYWFTVMTTDYVQMAFTVSNNIVNLTLKPPVQLTITNQPPAQQTSTNELRVSEIYELEFDIQQLEKQFIHLGGCINDQDDEFSQTSTEEKEAGVSDDAVSLTSSEEVVDIVHNKFMIMDNRIHQITDFEETYGPDRQVVMIMFRKLDGEVLCFDVDFIVKNKIMFIDNARELFNYINGVVEIIRPDLCYKISEFGIMVPFVGPFARPYFVGYIGNDVVETRLYFDEITVYGERLPDTYKYTEKSTL